MKKFITLLIILVSQSIIAQWVQQSAPTTENLNDVFCISEDIVLVVGNNGTILKTTNGGVNWVQKTSGTNLKLMKVQFPTQNIGYIIGFNTSNGSALLFKTIDAGETWTSINATETIDIQDFSCVDENVIYITKNDGSFKKSINAGVSFELINDAQFFQNIQFVNELNGFASSSGILMKTTDGGFNWVSIGSVDIGFSTSSFYFINDAVGFVKKSNKQLHKTIDGGLNYTYLSTLDYYMPKLFASSENVIWGVTVDLLLNGQPNYTMRGEVSNLNNFQKVDASFPILNSIYFINPTKGYGVASGGQIFKNSTGTMLGLNEVNNKDYLKIYPNPSSDEVTVSFDEIPTQKVTIQIIDTLGKTISIQNYFNQNNIIINTKLISKGVYYLNVINQDKRQTQKLIIN
jgi:photosystem II stability/assembly factor-like uncharacterized protein